MEMALTRLVDGYTPPDRAGLSKTKQISKVFGPKDFCVN